MYLSLPLTRFQIQIQVKQNYLKYCGTVVANKWYIIAFHLPPFSTGNLDTWTMVTSQWIMNLTKQLAEHLLDRGAEHADLKEHMAKFNTKSVSNQGFSHFSLTPIIHCKSKCIKHLWNIDIYTKSLLKASFIWPLCEKCTWKFFINFAVLVAFQNRTSALLWRTFGQRHWSQFSLLKAFLFLQ